jgi:G patch domain and KOW motifs-containing protein
MKSSKCELVSNYLRTDEKEENWKWDKKKKHKDKNKERWKHKWIEKGLLVWVISKSFKDGKLYNQKVIIHDVHDKYSFTVVDLQGTLYSDMKEKYLETTIPWVDERVMILSGVF